MIIMQRSLWMQKPFVFIPFVIGDAVRPDPCSVVRFYAKCQCSTVDTRHFSHLFARSVCRAADKWTDMSALSIPPTFLRKRRAHEKNRSENATNIYRSFGEGAAMHRAYVEKCIRFSVIPSPNNCMCFVPRRCILPECPTQIANSRINFSTFDKCLRQKPERLAYLVMAFRNFAVQLMEPGRKQKADGERRDNGIETNIPFAAMLAPLEW